MGRGSAKWSSYTTWHRLVMESSEGTSRGSKGPLNKSLATDEYGLGDEL